MLLCWFLLVSVVPLGTCWFLLVSVVPRWFLWFPLVLAGFCLVPSGFCGSLGKVL